MHLPGLMSVLIKYEPPLSIKHVYLLVKQYDNMSMRYRDFYTCKMTIIFIFPQYIDCGYS